MAKNTQRKDITPAQSRRLRVQVDRFNAAKTALDEWVEYLTEEHDAAGWLIAPDLTAFVREEGDDGSDD